MKPIYKMKVIQIEITNACPHGCSNCTRFCGHHPKPFFMELETFKKAVDSLEDFPGMAGVMGGEPTIHPEFDRLIGYYTSKIEQGKKYKNALNPIKNFSRYLVENDMQNIRNRRGLWSSLGHAYYKHFELIQESFPFQLINDHSHSGLHQSLLITRKELGIPDDEWIKMRDNCWAQNLWSASITPKGCFFCEVAAALDMLFDGPGGWPIEKGWWKRRPEDFGEQLNWCEYCSAVLNVPRVEANLGTDIISPAIYEKLKAIGSPKVTKGKYKIFDVKSYHEQKHDCAYSSEWYLPSGDNTMRVSSTNRSIYPKKLSALVLTDAGNVPDYTDLNNFDSALVLDFSGKLKNDAANIKVLDVSAMSVEAAVSEGLKQLDFSDWVVIMESDVKLALDFRETFFSWIFNPGCVYCGPERGKAPVASEKQLAADTKDAKIPYSFMILNRNASAFKTSCADYKNILTKWPHEKIVHIDKLKDDNSNERLELLSKGEKQKTALMTSHVLSLWRSLSDMGLKLALFGAGAHTKWLLNKLQEANLPPAQVIFDDDPDTQTIENVPVAKSSDKDLYKYAAVIVSSDTYADKMTLRALEIWNEKSQVRVINPYRDYPDPFFQK